MTQKTHPISLDSGSVFFLNCKEAQYKDRRGKQARLNTTTPFKEQFFGRKGELRRGSSEEFRGSFLFVISLLKIQKPQSQRDMSLFLTI